MEHVHNFLKKSKQIELKLVLFVVYMGILVNYYFQTHSWLHLLYAHIASVFLYSIYHFGLEFLYICVAPMIAVTLPFQNYLSRRYIKQFKQNVTTDVVIILAYSNWFKLEAWIKPNYISSELKNLVKLLQAKQQDFSFHIGASVAEVEKIMADKNIKEVYFVGHGTSHVFQLNTDDILYYCDFNDIRYGKEFVHQIHCGTKGGKSLVDYVVPENNRNGCFLIRKSINGYDIEKEFNRKIKDLSPVLA